MKTILEHNGYIGSVEISIEDKCLYGKIEFINDLVTYQGQTVDELENAFKESVDDYLATCKEVNKVPDKPFSGTFNIRIGPCLHREIAIAARRADTTINDYIRSALEANASERNHTIVHFHKHDHSVHHFEMETTKAFVFNDDTSAFGARLWKQHGLTSSRI
jgi:predicted HicB family RNase H-like nuclease